MVKNENFLKEELERIVRSRMPFSVTFKEVVSSEVVSALDALSEMEITSRTEIGEADLEKMRRARMDGEWPSEKPKDRTIVVQPGELFKLKVFLTRVAPAIKELREYSGSV